MTLCESSSRCPAEIARESDNSAGDLRLCQGGSHIIFMPDGGDRGTTNGSHATTRVVRAMVNPIGVNCQTGPRGRRSWSSRMRFR